MGYRVPNFNLWALVTSASGAEIGWTRCQLRGPTNTPIDLEQSDEPPSCRIVWEILLPAGSDVRTRNCSGVRGSSDWDRIMVCGELALTFIVQSVGDKGAGFDNEYRLCYVTPELGGSRWVNGLPRVNPAVEPPEDYTPLPIVDMVG